MTVSWVAYQYSCSKQECEDRQRVLPVTGFIPRLSDTVMHSTPGISCSLSILPVSLSFQMSIKNIITNSAMEYISK